MGQKTAFATDFDGTLYFHGDGDYGDQGPDGYRTEDIAAIRAYQEAGGLFGICTGRSIGMLAGQYFGLFEPDFVITQTGACILDGNGELLWERPAPTEMLRAIDERYSDAAQAIIICTRDDGYILRGGEGFPLTVVPSMDALEGPFYDMSIEYKPGQEDLAARAAAEINADFGDGLAAYQNLMSVDIVAKGCSKGAGVRRVRQALSVDLIAGMGDSFNDLSMLEAADVAYTFPYAPKEVRAAADTLVSGIAEALGDLQRRSADGLTGLPA